MDEKKHQYFENKDKDAQKALKMKKSTKPYSTIQDMGNQMIGPVLRQAPRLAIYIKRDDNRAIAGATESTENAEK